jgi:hypothetical protein
VMLVDEEGLHRLLQLEAGMIRSCRDAHTV